jgi:hypothetical protein
VYSAQATSKDALAALSELLAEKRSDPEIADELNRRGLRTGYGKSWDVAAVRRHRYSRGWQSETEQHTPDQREDGMYSVYGIALRLNVTPQQVRNWVKQGHLKAAEGGGGPGRPLWFKLDEETEGRLTERARRIRRATTPGQSTRK